MEETKKAVGRPKKDPSLVRSQRRYNLTLPTDKFNEVKDIAEEEGVSFLQVVQRFIQVGVILHRANKNDSQLILRKINKDGVVEEERLVLL